MLLVHDNHQERWVESDSGALSLLWVALAQKGFGTEHRYWILKPSPFYVKLTVFDLEGVAGVFNPF